MLTVVVNYPSQVSRTIDAIKSHIPAAARLTFSEPKLKSTGGYYATHIVLTSDHDGHRRKKCEIQVKTVLHDAWGAKTHDLTYKPKGQFDRRFETMMQVFGDSLQAIEQQSELLRELIEERWRAEHQWRLLARQTLLRDLPNWKVHGESAKALRQRIDTGIDHLRGCLGDDHELQDILSGIDRLSQENLPEAYVVRAFLAIERNDERQLGAAVRDATVWLDRCENSKDRATADLWSVPLVMQACNRIDEAIETGRRLLSGGFDLSAYDQAVVKMNLANHLIELEYSAPAIVWSRRGEREHEVTKLVTDAQNVLGHDLSPFRDTFGMIKVVFSDDPLDVITGIDLLEAGKIEEDQDEQKIAEAYYNLHSRIAWRKLLDLEARQRADR